MVSYGFDDFEKNVTTYFRKSFVRSVAVTNLALAMCFTDGAVVYLNGTEIFRRNLGTNTAYDTLAIGSNRERQDFWTAVPVTPSLLRTGTNVIAVELHRQERWTPDLSFDLQLVQANVALPVRFTAPPLKVAGNWRIPLAGPAGALARLEVSSDLSFWSVGPQLLLINGTNTYQEPIQPGELPRFFRVKRD